MKVSTTHDFLVRITTEEDVPHIPVDYFDVIFHRHAGWLTHVPGVTRVKLIGETIGLQ